MKCSCASVGGGAVLLAVVFAAGGCGSMSGLHGKSHYACKAPYGVACDSVTGTYANAIHHNLPGQQPPSRVPPAAAEPSSLAPSGTRTAPGFDPITAPLRSAPRILRLWFKPWEDADQDLFDQGYVYVQVDAGQWLIDHAQQAIRDAYRPLQPPSPAAPEDAKPEASPAAPFPPITLPPEDKP